MSKKVGILTFHAAHNYGSSLQAYALKTTYNLNGAQAEIINFRTQQQKDMYTPLTKRKGFKYLLKNAFFLLNYKSRSKKYFRFEKFINEKLLDKNCKEFSSFEELSTNPPQYDLYVCGSDQIWNTIPRDFSMAYFLPNVNGKKVSYAPSFGPIGKISNKYEISVALNSFSKISVREQCAKKLVFELTGKEVPILVDPTMLLSRDSWDELCDERLIKGEYIFFYSLFSNKKMIKEVKRISKALKLPVVVSNISNQFDLFTGFKRSTDAGPNQFISLIKNAKLVITSSFHGTVFSILYNKPLLVFGGMNDNRISTLLKNTGLENISFNEDEGLEKLDNAFNTSYVDANVAIEQNRIEAINYIKETLEL